MRRSEAAAAELLRSCRSWSELRARLAELDERAKGACFELLTEHFLRLSPVHRTQLRHVWSVARRDVPRRVREHVGLPGLDEGIDLVAETVDGRYWAIQCKYHHDECHSLTHRELATFNSLTFAKCRNFDLALVCTTGDRISSKLRGFEGRLQFCTGEVWRGLDAEFFRALRRALGGGPPPRPKRAKPRPHQHAAIRAAVDHFVTHANARGKLIMPCGTGKSLTGYWLAERLGARKVLVAVPSLALVRQTLAVWARESLAHGHTPRWIAVCSDESVADRDDAAVQIQDLGVRVHTDADEIAEWLSHHRRDERTIVFTTYQSGRATAEAARRARFRFDLGILDEAHKTVGRRDAAFAHLLHDDNVAIVKRVFMTATERRYRGDSDEIVTMDDAATYGDTFHLLSFQRALEAEPPILSDYRILTIAVTRADVRTLIARKRLVRPDGERWPRSEWEADVFAAAIALRKAFHRHRIRHAVSFHSSVARARAFQDLQDAFNRAGIDDQSIDVFHVSGKTPASARERELRDFAEAERALVTNARCLTEGVDVPLIDAVLFADPRRSTVDIVQAIGRALRPAPGKKRGYVVVPILVDSGTSKDLESSGAYDTILTVLRALAANDERIVEYFRTISSGRKWRGPKPVEIDVPLGLSIEAEDFAKAIELRAWTRLARLSWRPFEEAREFVRGLGLKSQSEWNAYARSSRKPSDIPSSPWRTYTNQGWAGFGDWLGTGRLADNFREYRPFAEAKNFSRTLGLKSGAEWTSYARSGKKPDDVPATPMRTYKDDGWAGMGDWLGTGTVATRSRQYLPFRRARTWVRRLRLTSQGEWLVFTKSGAKPDEIPANPRRVYRDHGWAGFGDWLGTGTIAPRLRKYRPFNQARAFVRSLGLKSSTEWAAYSKSGDKPDDIPSAPDRVYKSRGWVGLGDWLGTGTIAPSRREYRPFKRARAFARSLGLNTNAEWVAYAQSGKRPDDIPVAPWHVYKDTGWTGFGDWLGTGTIASYLREYRSFVQARRFTRGLGLNSAAEWFAYTKSGAKPNDIPANPNQVYRDKGWAGWGDWLGTGTVAANRRVYREFSEARAFAQQLALPSSATWFAYARSGKKPKDIPADPRQTYMKRGWAGMGDWLGTGRKRRVRRVDSAGATSKGRHSK